MTSQSRSEIAKSYEELLERFCKWAETRSDIRAAIVLGSGARVDQPADEWSDLDILFWTTDPEHYLSTSDWVSNFGKPLFTFIDTVLTGGDEKMRVVLYDGMLDVDFVPVTCEDMQRTSEWINQTLKANADQRALFLIRNVYGRGVRVLIDKDGLTGTFCSVAVSVEKPRQPRPTQDEFLEAVKDFLYHAVYVAKHLRRGELYWSVTRLDCRLQRSLLRMIEWHALAEHGWKLDVWFLDDSSRNGQTRRQ
jgi:aminoglycoside 6-adenylyltransferase